MRYKDIKSEKGFTLVELIVVLVILAILAAILVPALLGYIDRAKEGQDMIKARNMLQASQAWFSEAYAHDEDYTLYSGWKSDKDMTKTVMASDILKIADDDPYLCIIGVGAPDAVESKKLTLHDMYTVYFVAYWESVDKEPIFYNGETWMMDYPWEDDHANEFIVHGEKKKLALMFLKIPKGKTAKNVWSYLKKTLVDNGRDIHNCKY